MILSYQDAEYIAAIEEAWEEGLELANSTEGWKKEKEDKDTVRFDLIYSYFSESQRSTEVNNNEQRF